MIEHHAEYFKAWLGTFQEELLVILRVYADESILAHSAAPVKTLCGFVASPEDWGRFAKNWNAVLKKYDAPYFHFREFVDRRNKYKIKGNPFLNRDDLWRENFLDDLAIVLSETAVPVGGYLDIGAAKSIDFKGNDPDEGLIYKFYQSVFTSIDRHWPKFNGVIHFVFDEDNGSAWEAKIAKVHRHLQEESARLGTVGPSLGGRSFEDDKRCPPLQAADFYAFLAAQITESYCKQGKTRQMKRTLDWIISKNSFPGFKRIHTPLAWKKLVRKVLAHRKKMKAIWLRNGDSKRKYYPEKDFLEEAAKIGLPLIDADKV
jgi:hypothetical protein